MTVILVGSPAAPLREWHERGLLDSWAGVPTDGLSPGDATYGYSLERLLAPQSMPDAPPDFGEFWGNLAARSRELKPSLVITETARAPGQLAKTHDLLTAKYVSGGEITVGCWVVIPRTREPERNLTITHGYGGRCFGDLDEPLIGARDAAIFPCLRGLGALSVKRGIPVAAREHVLHGIADKNTYILGGCVTDVWRASAELDHLVGSRPHSYFGASFGGGIGALAIQEARYARAVLHVPTFGHHRLRLRWPSLGSGEGLRQRYLKDPRILEVLAYFDAATAASRVTTPTMVSAAQWDPAVPPPGQFAVFHALAGQKLLVVQDAAHTEFPSMAAQERARLELTHDWLHSD